MSHESLQPSTDRLERVARLPSIQPWLTVASTLPGVDLAAIATTLRFQRAADGILHAFEAFFAEYGLSDGRFTLLMVFLLHPADTPPPTPSALAARLGVTRATVTGLLDGLERAGLVQRCPHPTDRRRLIIKMTEAGRALVTQVLPPYFQRAARLAQTLTTEEQAELERLLTKLYAATNDIGPSTPPT